MENVDQEVEGKALRKLGFIGRGGGMGNVLYATDYTQLPPEAIYTIQLIVQGGPFPYPHDDGKPFKNRFGDLPSYTSADYLEFTVPMPRVKNKQLGPGKREPRGARRIVARRSGVLFFTACHYDRVQGSMSVAARQTATAAIDEEWRNGFYVVTGMPASLRARLRNALKAP